MSVFEAMVLAIAFAGLVIKIIKESRKSKQPIPQLGSYLLSIGAAHCGQLYPGC